MIILSVVFGGSALIFMGYIVVDYLAKKRGEKKWNSYSLMILEEELGFILQL